jgi:hypothetical protein
MDGIWAGGLAVALTWWGASGAGHLAPTPAPIAQSPRAARPLGVALGKPIAATLDAPRRLPKPAPTTVAFRVPDWYPSPTGRKMIVRAQSLDEPPPLPHLAASAAKVEDAFQGEAIGGTYVAIHVTPGKADPAIASSQGQFAIDRPVRGPKPATVHVAPGAVRAVPAAEGLFAADRNGVLVKAEWRHEPALGGFAVDRDGAAVDGHTEESEDEQPAADADAAKEPAPLDKALEQGAADAAPATDATPAADAAPAADEPPAPKGPAIEEAAPRPTAVPLDCTAGAAVGPRLVPAVSDGVPVDPNRFYALAEYLSWWARTDHVPPLVTTGPPASEGILGRPGTQVLFGGNLHEDIRSGGRFTVGYWLDCCHDCGIESSFFFLEPQNTRFSASSDVFPLLARPFLRQNDNTEFREIATRPGLSTGSVTVDTPSKFYGGDLNLRHNVCCGCNYRVDGLLGVRYLNLEEGVHITENLLATPGGSPFGGSHILVSDRFDTRNQFYGAQVGLDAEYRFGKVFVDARGKLAVGDTHQTLDIAGSQVVIDPAGNISTFRGGLLALPSNIGHYTRDRIGFVPEIGLSVGYQFNDAVRFSVGYNALYWVDVLRPGQQIDRVLDVTQIPNFSNNQRPTANPRPLVPFKETDFWAQGLTIGLELRY